MLRTGCSHTCAAAGCVTEPELWHRRRDDVVDLDLEAHAAQAHLMRFDLVLACLLTITNDALVAHGFRLGACAADFALWLHLLLVIIGLGHAAGGGFLENVEGGRPSPNSVRRPKTGCRRCVRSRRPQEACLAAAVRLGQEEPHDFLWLCCLWPTYRAQFASSGRPADDVLAKVVLGVPA